MPVRRVASVADLRDLDLKMMMGSMALYIAMLVTDGSSTLDWSNCCLLGVSTYVPRACLHLASDAKYIRWRSLVLAVCRIASTVQAAQAMVDHNRTVELTGAFITWTFLLLGSGLVCSVFAAAAARLSMAVQLLVVLAESSIFLWLTTPSIVAQLQNAPAAISTINQLWDLCEVYASALLGLQLPHFSSVVQRCGAEVSLNTKVWRILTMVWVFVACLLPGATSLLLPLQPTAAPQLVKTAAEQQQEQQRQQPQQQQPQQQQQLAATYECPKEGHAHLLPAFLQGMSPQDLTVPITLLTWYLMPCSWPEPRA